MEASRQKKLASLREWKKRNPDYNALWRAKNPGYGARYIAKWKADHPERAAAIAKRYARKNAARIAVYQRAYRTLNKSVLRVSDRKRKSLRYKTDPWFRVRENLRNRINEAIQESGWTKRSKTGELIGCSWQHLKAHIESLFQFGMTWGNYGEWHVDHEIPCKAFDLCNAEEQRRCMNWTNLQPLWALDNLRKGAKINASCFASCRLD